MTSYRMNEQHHGIEITFDNRPSAATLETLKSNGFRWHRGGGYWYAKQSAERIELVKQIAEGRQGEAKKIEHKASPAKVNKYGVMVGDWFVASWGYEQTNVDFFQVVELVGASSIRVRQAAPELIENHADGLMCATRTYKLTSEIRPATRSVFIDDNERGDLKRLKSYSANGVSNPQFRLDSFAAAHYCGHEGTRTEYESWYY